VVQEEEEVVQFQVPSITEYAKIADENLFHPERKIPTEKKEEQPLPKPEFVLYGTLISDELSLAYLEDVKAPRSSPGRGKRQVALKKGDSMSGFTLKEIEADKIVMLRGEEKIVVNISDPTHPKAREASQTVATAASQQQPAPISSRPPVSAASQKPAEAARQPGTVPKQLPASAPPPRVTPSSPRKALSDIFRGR
jgi:hypothetical protein